MVLSEADWDDEERLIADLAECGVSRNEARLYLAAVGGPPMRVAELAELAEINRPKAYDAAHLLVGKGLFTELPGRVARFEAAEPKVVVQRLRQQSISEQAQLVEDTSRLVADLFQRYYIAAGTDDPFDFVELIRNFEAAWARCEAVAAAVQWEVLTACKLLPGSPAPAHRMVGDQVRYRTTYETVMLEDPAFHDKVAEREAAGEEIRFVDQIAMSMCLVDRATLVLALTPDGVATGPGTWLVFEQQGFASLLARAFDRQWATAEPIGSVGVARAGR